MNSLNDIRIARRESAHLTAVWLAGICVLSCLLWGYAVDAAVPGSAETWNLGATENWTRQDPLNASTGPLTNPTNYLQIAFDTQTMPFPEVNILRADVSASSGRFVGSYWSSAITNVSFRLYCENLTPADLRLYLHSSVNDDWWYYRLSVTETGEWTAYSLPVLYSDGWHLASKASATRFKQALQHIDWVGVYFQRNSSTQGQVYRIDDFVIRGASKLIDADYDGVSDWQEFMAGTDPGNASSLFECQSPEATETGGVLVQWASEPARTYAVHRSEGLTQGFQQLEAGIGATPPENTYRDLTATGSGPYFYKVLAE